MSKQPPPKPELVVQQWLRYCEGYQGPKRFKSIGPKEWPFQYTDFGGGETWNLKFPNMYAAPRTHRRRLIDYAYSHYGPGYGLQVATAFALYDREQKLSRP